MKIKRDALIRELRDLTAEAKANTLTFRALPIKQLNSKPTDTSWSVLECIEHLNRYGNFYLPELEARITGAQASQHPYFKEGVLGRYFVNMIRATNTKKYKTVKEMDTTGSDLSLATIDQFIKQLDWLDTLLERAENVHLTRVKTAISLTTWIKLRLGDTLRFLVYHNERHMLQAKKVLEGKT